jgi:uncharacterized membrane protein YidH (DUF202 family)
MSSTVFILTIFTIYTNNKQWNNFSIGLLLMIASLSFRIILELQSVKRKERESIALDNKSFNQYLIKHYNARLKLHYIVTPICFVIYTFGFTMLLPYFKQYFSSGFYNYILISGVLSLFIVAVIIVNGIVKEVGFLKQCRKNGTKSKL